MLNPSVKSKSPRVSILLLYFFASLGCFWSSSHGEKLTLVGDMNSPFSRMMNLSMVMAISDFYSAHPHYKTRLRLSTKDAKSVSDFNLAVLESAKREEVVGILQPGGSSSSEAFAAGIGESFQVPIISFTGRSSLLSQAESSYLVRTTMDDAVQAQALAATCQKFNWTKVLLLYEDTGYGSLFLSHTIKAFQEVDIGLSRMNSLPTSAEESDILKVLDKLKEDQTKVFLVHLNPELGRRLFALADTAGMMNEGYAWIITDSLSIFTNSINFNGNGSMDGVLGIRPYAASKNLESFQKRWKRELLVDKMNTPIMEINIYGLWAYNAITALAVAMEEIGPVNSNTAYGQRLLSKLFSMKFRGLTGSFQLFRGKLKPAAYEIFNIIGSGERRVGFWTPDRGIVSELSASTSELKKIMWPGSSVIPPRGWRIPATGNLRVGVPQKPLKEFINVTFDPVKNHTNATGFTIDIFLAALKELPFPITYDFYHYNISKTRTYDDMLQRIPQEFDMVVGDTMIWAPRTEFVDFSLPYSESGIVLVVKNRKPLDMWIYIKPLRWDLWLSIFIACIFMGVVLHILERRTTITDKGSARPRPDRPGLIYWFPIAILAFPERNMVSNKWSVFALVCWLFMAFILMQSFTANLSAILTVDQFKFTFSEDYYVGYHEGSFLKTYLTQQLHINESKLRPCATLQEFHEAIVRGSKNGGVDVIFGALPFMKLLLHRYKSQYKIVGPTYRTNGFGFAFPKGSPLTAHFSAAILKVIQGPEMNYLEQKNFGLGYSSQDPMSSVISQGTSSLTLRQFSGLFITVGSLTLFALFCSETSIGRKITDALGHFIQNGFSSTTAQVNADGDAMAPSRVGSSHEFREEDNGQDVPRRDGDEADETGMNNEVVIALEDDVMRVENHR